MSTRRRKNSRVSIAFLLCSVLLSLFPEFVSTAVVTLDSVEIFKIHEWLTSEPAIFFQCKGENKTVLPDVKKTNVSLTFNGEESWQPLTKFSNKKCKRCGLYEKGSIKSDDVFDEWELCPSDFKAPDGTYNRFTDKEFNATFLCQDCVPLAIDSDNPSGSQKGGKEMHWVVVVMISVAASIVCIVGLVAGYKCWQKRKREHDKLRFLKLFEEGDDDIDDELGIGPLTNAI